ncbi:MAG: PLDc N-terminal domain-containing protein [Chloroflexi bacterium]|nr:PLDc N-terminal domain-containing protein [Chloroflexota bacterium]OJV89157.1 MAG: hypothetical protein BGO39_34665 [Chloroflexi bacterium 54-19]
MSTFVAISLVFTLLAGGFWLWMAWDLGGNNQLSSKQKTYWILILLFFNVFGAIFYYANEYRKR